MPTEGPYYVAGKFTAPDPEGIARNVARACAAGSRLAGEGLEVIVPHVAVPKHFSWDEAMIVCKALLMSCRTIALLPGWQESRGARQEHEWAVAAGLGVVYLPECYCSLAEAA